MPLRRALARFNRYVTNPVQRVWAGRAAPWAIVEHEGRRSGREFRTPVWAFPIDDGYLVALTYRGPSDWVANVVASGGILVRSGRHLEIVAARIVEPDEGYALVPRRYRWFIRSIDPERFLALDTLEA
jgi:deazaflavin-dependent oxidoreductase (nitroreductase family)